MSKNKKSELPSWDLSQGYYPAFDSIELKRDLSETHKLSVFFEKKYSGDLETISADEFAKSLQEYDEIFGKTRKVKTYFSLLEATQFKDPLRDNIKQTVNTSIDLSYSKIHNYQN